jgi:hypothetical protein
MFMDEEACCPASVVRKIRKVGINGLEVGIAQLDETIGKAAAMGLSDEQDTGRALMKEAIIYNQVPSNKESDYRSAILLEYVRRK